MELYTAHRAGIPAAVSPVTAEAASSDPAQRLRARKDPHLTHHDLRELFSLTRTLGELVEEVGKNSVHGPSESMEQSLSLLITGASRLGAAAENLRERSNAGNTQGGIFWEHFDVEELFRVLMISTRALVGGKPVKVEMVSGEAPLTMWSDSDKVMQIASNLLGNAARYTDRGRITLILGRQQDQLTLMVTDTGKGMTESDAKRITSRINDRVRKMTSGSRAVDAGLIRTNALVELLGGKLSLASRLNEGTIVEVRLPLGAIRVEPAPVRELAARPRV